MKYPIQHRYHSFKQKRLAKRESKPPLNHKIAVPSFFTLMNLFSGFLSIVAVSEGELFRGAWFIVAAGFFDVMDGYIARLANADSDFGVELDSLSDIVSFGVAPSFLIYTFALHEFQFLGMLISAVPAMCGAVRLARFNVNTRLTPNQHHFIGLPIPSLAIILAAFYLSFHHQLELFDIFRNGVSSVLGPLIILLSVLMLSTLPFDKVPKMDRVSFQQNGFKSFLFLGYFTLILLFRELGLMAVILIYILKGIVDGLREYFSTEQRFISS
ncbi:CDP-diacylglycerol--serine O-phosphatidyltransferase [Bacteroidota bacterium]|jgi:CDP-diacylglycerol--serine O-phosphatidyltransferase|nr:CDP-diacylglycerol--serine O-phosphatidyltransferase [Balneolaceae bacterium]MDC3136326.1 CDP-diacylglycerol--serine O-phosphatidyltransferase [Bacteroidota bacterium]